MTMTTPPPFIPVEGRRYAETLDTAQVGEWIIVRDVNENHGSARVSARHQVAQAEVVERTKGTLTVAGLTVARCKVSLGTRNPEQRGRIDSWKRAQSLADYRTEADHEGHLLMLQSWDMRPVGRIAPALAAELAAVLLAWETEHPDDTRAHRRVR